MTATSPSVATVAARLLRRKHLSDADLDAVQAVAASALNQREKEASRRKVAAAYARVGARIQSANLAPAGKRALLDELEKLGAILFPAKP